MTRSLGLGAWQDKTPPEQVQFRRGFCECRLEAEGVVQAVTSSLTRCLDRVESRAGHEGRAGRGCGVLTRIWWAPVRGVAPVGVALLKDPPAVVAGGSLYVARVFPSQHAGTYVY